MSLPTLLDQRRGKRLSGIVETGDEGPEFFDGRGVFRVVDLVGPFVRILGRVVEFLFFGPIAGVASEFMPDADVSEVRLGFIAQPGDGGAFPWSLRGFEQRNQLASIYGRGWR